MCNRTAFPHLPPPPSPSTVLYQVRFVFEAFRKLRPGVPLMALHGKVKQQKRMATYFDFCKKKAAVLFATDIAARGLDFPNVDWVMQVRERERERERDTHRERDRHTDTQTDTELLEREGLIL